MSKSILKPTGHRLTYTIGDKVAVTVPNGLIVTTLPHRLRNYVLVGLHDRAWFWGSLAMDVRLKPVVLTRELEADV